MKNKLNENKSFGVAEVIAILIVLFGFLIILAPELINQAPECAEQTKVPEGGTEEPATGPEPLVIEPTQWTPHGVFEGTIVISGEGIEDSGYEGIMYIELDRDKIRISCTGAVRSRYGELF